MVANLSLLSLSSKVEANGDRVVDDSACWTWSPNKFHDDKDSWEVKAFAEDTSNIMGATWPPRSYTCTFCRREFRSAQALGGHMNVHRKDRARINRSQYPNPYHCSISASSSSSPPHLMIPPGNGVFSQSRIYASFSSSFILYPQGNIDRSTRRIACESQLTAHKGENNHVRSVDVKEEIDLELRLGKAM